MWLIFTGWSIGCVTRYWAAQDVNTLKHIVTSVKWIGLFVTALVGIYTIEDLWDKFGDLRMPVVCLMKLFCN